MSHGPRQERVDMRIDSLSSKHELNTMAICQNLQVNMHSRCGPKKLPNIAVLLACLESKMTIRLHLTYARVTIYRPFKFSRFLLPNAPKATMDERR